MSTDPAETERVVLTTDQEEQTGGWLDALSSRFRQSTETRTSSPSVDIFRRGVPTVEPAEGVDEYYQIYRETAIVFTSLWNFSSDVWEPGYRVELNDEDDDATNGDGQTAAEWLEEEWLPQAAVMHGGKHNDLLGFGKQTTIQRWARGGALIEHIRADRDDPDALITGLNFIPPETVSFVPYQHKPILVDPNPDDLGLGDELPNGLNKTRRGESPAYIQYHRNAPRPTSREPIRLSQNDVTRTIFAGDAAGVGTDLNNFWGSPATEIISEDVAGLKNILRDKETAIKNKAYGLWKMAFNDDVLEYTDVNDAGQEVEVTKLTEWTEAEMGEVSREVEDEMGPGSILTHDGAIELDSIDGEVPDVIDDLKFYVNNITSALPTPLYVVGFEKNINQFVTEKQDKRYQRLIDEEREELERLFSDICQRVIDSHPEYDDISITFKIEPPASESPVLSLTDEEVERMATWAEAFERVRGDLPVEMMVEPDVIRDLILQLPEDAAPDDTPEDEIDEDDEQVQEQIRQMQSMMAGEGEDEGENESRVPAEADD